MSNPIDTSARMPVRAVLVIGGAIALFVVFAVVAVAGSYVLTLHAIHVQDATNAAQAAAAKAAQIKSSLPTCRALVSLANTAHGIKFSPPTKTGTAELYILRLVKSLRQVVGTTGCQALLKSHTT